MAVLANTSITSPNGGTGFSSGFGIGQVHLNFFLYDAYVPSSTHLHFKTNIARYSDQMYMIEAIGYNYGRGQAIQCAFTGYMYNSPGTTIHSPTQFQGAPGLVADGQYVSSDNFLVLRFSTNTTVYAGFVLNAYFTNPNSNLVAPQITAYNAGTNSGTVY